MNSFGGFGGSASGKSNVMISVLAKHAHDMDKPVVFFDIEADYTIFDSRTPRRRCLEMNANRQRDEGERWWKRVFG